MLLLALFGAASAAPVELAHSGRVLDDLGAPLSGPVSLTVALYDSEGAVGSAWSESFDLTLEQGYYAVELGTTDGNPLELNDFATGELWVGITPGSAADELVRTRLLSVPFAVQAATAQSVDGTTAHLTESAIYPVQRQAYMQIDQTYNGLLPTRGFTFTKERDDTSILFEWYDNFRCSAYNGHSDIACRWEVKFRPASAAAGTGSGCNNGYPIRMDYYNGIGNNNHEGRTVRGVCETLDNGVPFSAGEWVVEIYHSPISAHNPGAPYIGWSQPGLITVQEIH